MAFRQHEAVDGDAHQFPVLIEDRVRIHGRHLRRGGEVVDKAVVAQLGQVDVYKRQGLVSAVLGTLRRWAADLPLRPRHLDVVPNYRKHAVSAKANPAGWA